MENKKSIIQTEREAELFTKIGEVLEAYETGDTIGADDRHSHARRVPQRGNRSGLVQRPPVSGAAAPVCGAVLRGRLGDQVCQGSIGHLKLQRLQRLTRQPDRATPIA
jgi:hypothetical protein